MADAIFGKFGDLLSGILDWITGGLSGLLSNLAGMLGEALIGAAAETLQDIATDLIRSGVNATVSGIEDVQWLPEWVKYGLTTFAGNVGSNLDMVATSAITLAREGSSQILGVTNAQENYMNSLQSTLDTTFDALLTRIETQGASAQEMEEQTIAAIIDGISQSVTFAYDQASEFLKSTQIGVTGQMEGARTWGLELLGSTLLSVQTSGKTALDMFDRSISGISSYLQEVAVVQPEMYFAMLKDTIMTPAANAEAMQWALSNIDTPTDEEMLETLKHLAFVYNELAVDMAAKQAIVPEFTVRKRTE